jgi:hypothetical protein
LICCGSEPAIFVVRDRFHLGMRGGSGERMVRRGVIDDDGRDVRGHFS